MDHTIPSHWMAEAGMQSFVPKTQSFRCDEQHVLMAVVDIETPHRREGVTLDANGFGRERMLYILRGIRDGDPLPPIEVEIADPGQRPYRLRGGFHRFYASLTCRFSHIPVDIVPRY
jgi:hypothetical protein